MTEARRQAAPPRRSRSTVALFIVSLCLTPLLVDADVIVVGRVEVGESDYEIPVEITNKSSAVVRGLSVKVVTKPAGLTAFSVDFHPAVYWSSDFSSTPDKDQ